MTDLKPTAGALVRQGAGGTELAVTSETAATAVAKRQEATIQALFVMAERKPRDWDDVRTRLLRDCQRPGFAEVARYHKPIGQGVEGPSIRFAEAAMRAMGNLMIDAQITLEDAIKRKFEVVIIDLESCLRFAREIVIEKTVERSYVKDGQTVLGERTNSKGKTVYLVQATEDELANKQAAQISKAMRSEGLRLLPGDILEECMSACLATLADKDAKDPDSARKKVIDAFAGVNVTPVDLREYLGHEVAKVVPAELAELRALYQAIKDGEATWQAAIEERRAKRQAALSGVEPIPGAATQAREAVSVTAEAKPAKASLIVDESTTPDKPQSGPMGGPNEEVMAKMAEWEASSEPVPRAVLAELIAAGTEMPEGPEKQAFRSRVMALQKRVARPQVQAAERQPGEEG